jgi:hypothetical protein
MCPSLTVPVIYDDISTLQEKVLELLEAAGIPTETNDRIVKLIEAAEAEMFADADWYSRRDR